MKLLGMVEELLTANIDFAHSPSVNETRSTLRPLSARENMRRAKALATLSSKTSPTACSGQIFVGIFFDGTGNNREVDYVSVKGEPGKHKHSNVVRLFHTYPDGQQRGTTRYYRFYVPGVGTAFPEIGDNGGTLGTGMSWNGEPRLIWGITRIFNAVSDFVSDSEIIPADQAGRIANGTGGVGSTAVHRNHVFGTFWAKRLEAMVSSRNRNKPYPEQINVSVFGFSRGAAEARAFVNWLHEICKSDGGGYTLAGIPLRLDFLGIFDTVASVGIAGAFATGVLGSEGRQSWASDNMQIHPNVESCLHIVAAHEVRATFPLDSVRVEGKYPPNVKEYVYPGAHSDVGGGYSSNAQGKTDALARIAGFEMYCAALAAGVPFLSFTELDPKTRNELAPSENALAAFKSYMQSAGIQEGPVEAMMRAHMGAYFTYRYQGRRDPYSHPQAGEYRTREFFRKTSAERVHLQDTQEHFVAVLAAVVETMEHSKQSGSSVDSYLAQPYQDQIMKYTSFPSQRFAWLMAKRILAIQDSFTKPDCDRVIDNITKKLDDWRKWLSSNNYPFLHDAETPERDVLNVVKTIKDVPQNGSIVKFFDYWVHDSMAGLAFDNVNEFLINGIGLVKFRRVYWGNRGDAMLKEKIAADNFALTASSNQKRQRREQ
ncbi:DUF2235 domain-containing protein [Massilia sp. Dwa41.01b]|uniref:T6SS phospholipase effector Tle1-like catalytic domain-containing protein n=1 Tax=unclassified Massilia TaxID=2609279 RepID=UPI001601D67B|nr:MULTISPECIES: DUF2235 domain-containing protein [unclassified Massilia]QNA90178.1 DUF2235 domain-containing protein [Massilia sp. Dwa41.01b]QNB01070.1 DUF2235 domain-containing protein [Massilia sp. Se16.2.3]